MCPSDCVFCRRLFLGASWAPVCILVTMALRDRILPCCVVAAVRQPRDSSRLAISVLMLLHWLRKYRGFSTDNPMGNVLWLLLRLNSHLKTLVKDSILKVRLDDLKGLSNLKDSLTYKRYTHSRLSAALPWRMRFFRINGAGWERGRGRYWCLIFSVGSVGIMRSCPCPGWVAQPLDIAHELSLLLKEAALVYETMENVLALVQEKKPLGAQSNHMSPVKPACLRLLSSTRRREACGRKTKHLAEGALQTSCFPETQGGGFSRLCQRHGKLHGNKPKL